VAEEKQLYLLLRQVEELSARLEYDAARRWSYLGPLKRRSTSAISAVLTQIMSFMLIGMTTSAQINAVTPTDKPFKCGRATGVNK
jgi:hypothetical protein